MSRWQWDDLPASVRTAIQAECGDVQRAETAAEGVASDFAGTLHLAHGGRVFCKAVRHNNRLAWMHHTEARVNPWVGGIAPRLRWELSVDGWLVLGFEHSDGRHADLSPGSADLPLVAQVLSQLHEELTPAPPVRLQPLADRWRPVPGWKLLAEERPADLDPWCRQHVGFLVEWEARAPELVDGNTLLHTDLTRHNLLVEDERRVRVIDWAWPARGAAWVDVAFIVIRLMDAGHTAEQAEAWAATVPVWRDATPAGVTAFAVAAAGLWEWRSGGSGGERRARLKGAAVGWAKGLESRRTRL